MRGGREDESPVEEKIGGRNGKIQRKPRQGPNKSRNVTGLCCPAKKGPSLREKRNHKNSKATLTRAKEFNLQNASKKR